MMADERRECMGDEQPPGRGLNSSRNSSVPKKGMRRLDMHYQPEHNWPIHHSTSKNLMKAILSLSTSRSKRFTSIMRSSGRILDSQH